MADRPAIEKAVRDYAADLRARRPEIERIIWFGSWVSGVPTPGSDVDLCLVLTHSARPRRERTPDYLPFGFPVGVDLAVYTREEFARLREESRGWYEVLAKGVDL